MAPQDVCRDLHGETFRDPAEVDLHARTGEPERVIRRVDPRAVVIHQRPYRSQLSRCRDVRDSVVETPEPDSLRSPRVIPRIEGGGLMTHARIFRHLVTVAVGAFTLLGAPMA